MAFRKPHQTADANAIQEKSNGGKEIRPKGFNIIWGNDLRYWKISTEKAELIQVSWLEVSGKVKVEKGKRYSVKFNIDVKQDGFGWENTEVLVMAKVGKKGRYEFDAMNLKCGVFETNAITIKVDEQEKDLELYFGLYEVWSGKWKGGLVINKADVDVV